MRQEVGLEPPWGTNGALVYFAVLAAVFVLLGWLKLRRVSSEVICSIVARIKQGHYDW